MNAGSLNLQTANIGEKLSKLMKIQDSCINHSVQIIQNSTHKIPNVTNI